MFLYVVRHGDSVYNAAGRAEGHYDSGLTFAGINYAVNLVPILEKEPQAPSIIFSSDLARSYNTATVMADKLRIDTNRICLTKFLREVNYGDYAGMKFDDFDQIYKEDMDQLFPNGESRNFMRLRVLYYLTRFILKQPEVSILLIAHGGPLRSLLSEYAGIEFKTLYKKATEKCLFRFKFENETIQEVEYLYP